LDGFFDLLPALWKFLNASIAGAKQKQKKIMRTVGTGKEINIRLVLNSFEGPQGIRV
jgi:hypothetical protein